VLIFIFKGLSFAVFEIFGRFSYEVYLIHWPLLSRYDVLFKNFEPFAAVFLFLALFLGLSYLLSLVVRQIDNLVSI
jgi:peptidoglycan/LPS O-acetylase OafA/YrhL